MKLMDFYAAILATGNLYPDSEGRISAHVGDVQVPTSVKEKRLVLPTKANMQNPDKSGIVMFHPLTENILHGESDVMAKFRGSVNIALNMRLSFLTFHLLRLATSPSMHSNLKPDQVEMMSVLKDADDKTLTLYQSILDKMKPGDADKCFVHFYMKRNGKIGDRAFRRVLVVSFPFYEELLKDEKSVYGVKLRKKDHQAIKGLLEQVLPNLNIKDSYNRGSTSDTSPSVEALLTGLMGVAGHINALVEEFDHVLPELKEFAYDDSWVDALGNLQQFTPEIRSIPMQTGNEGGSDRPAVAAAPAAPQLTHPTPQAHQPMHHQHTGLPMPAPVQHVPAAPAGDGIVRNANGSIDMQATMMARSGGQQPQQGMYPGMMGGMQPGMYPGMMMQQPQLTGAAAVRHPNAPPAYERPGTIGSPVQPGFGYAMGGVQQPWGFNQGGMIRV